MGAREKLFDYFQRVNEYGRLGASYLFIGEDDELVSDIIKQLSCFSKPFFCDKCWDCKRINQGNHPDVYTLKAKGFTITIEDVRQGMSFLSLKSFRLPRKYMLIKQAHLLSPAAANAFLKTIEEPPQHSFIAICTNQVDNMLPTIVSRCRKIFLPFNEDGSMAYGKRELIDFLGGKDLRLKERNAFKAFLWSLIKLLHQSLLAQLNGENNGLPKADACEIILARLGPNRVQEVLTDVLEIYAAHKTVNINLALQLIRLRLDAVR